MKWSAFQKCRHRKKANPVILVCQCSACTWIISNVWAWWRVQGVSGSATHRGWRPWKLKTGWKVWVQIYISESEPKANGKLSVRQPASTEKIVFLKHSQMDGHQLNYILAYISLLKWAGFHEWKVARYLIATSPESEQNVSLHNSTDLACSYKRMP